MRRVIGWRQQKDRDPHPSPASASTSQSQNPPQERTRGSAVATAAVDVFRTTLNLAKESSDVLPPLKTATGLVAGLWDIIDRVGESQEEARFLAKRAFAILHTMNGSMSGRDLAVIPPPVQQSIQDFEQLLRELNTTMKSIARRGRLHRFFHLRENESTLARFRKELDAAAEKFSIELATWQVTSLSRIENKQDAKFAALEESNIGLATRQVMSHSHIENKLDAKFTALEESNIGLATWQVMRIENKLDAKFTALEESNTKLQNQVHCLQIHLTAVVFLD